MATYELVVIGRGPSAYGALLRLVSDGRKPAVLAPLGQWTGEVIDPGLSPKARLARKTRFGSSAMYEYPVVGGANFDVDGPLPISGTPGGLSTVWGSNIQVFSAADLAAWGDAAGDMRDAYAALLARIPHQGDDDALSTRFPWPVPFPGQQPMSRRVRAALDCQLPRADVLVGTGRNLTAPYGQGCIACGLCLDGCPEGVIFDAGPAIDALVAAHSLPVIDALATRIAPEAAGVRIDVIERASGQASSITADRVLLGAGSIASTILLQRSGLLDGTATLDDTQVFYLPMLATGRPDAGPTTFTLAQMFATNAAGTSPEFHLSIYETSSSFEDRAAAIVGPLAKAVPQRIYKQVMAGIGFIPTQMSGKVLVSPSAGGDGRVTVTTMPNVESAAYVSRVLDAAAPAFASVGLRLIKPLVQISDVGASYHVGHLRVDGRRVVDTTSGSLDGAARILVVDGAGLPAVPTGPVTLTMMANAFRIAGRMQ